MLTDVSDEQIVELAQSDDQEAFGEIVRRSERKIFALCYGMLGSEQDARDAAQETFIAAYRNLKNFRGDSKLSSWLHRIAINQCISRQRRQKVRGETSIEDESVDQKFFAAPNNLPNAEAEQKEKFKIVRRAVDALPFELKQIVVMKEFEEMTFQEIAETLEIPLSTIKSRLYTALKQLKMKLEKSSFELI